MANKLKGLEEVDVNGCTYIFQGNFEFLAILQHTHGVDPMHAYSTLASGEGDPKLIRDVLTASLFSKAGKEISGAKRGEVVEELITLHGLQETCILAQHMLSYGMIGAVKKSRLGQPLPILEGLIWPSLKSRLYRWGVLLILFGSSVCISTSLSVMLL